MTLVRRGVKVAGDLTYSGGNPVYDGGIDLYETVVTENFHGDLSVAEWILAAKGVRMAVCGDSQWSGSSTRAYSAVIKTWGYTWSKLFGSVHSSDPVFSDISGGQDTYQSSAWTDNTSTSTSGKTVAQILTDEGLGDPTQIPTRWGWAHRTDDGNQMWFPTLRDVANPDPGYFSDPGNFDPVGGVHIRMKIAFLIGGASNAPDNVRIKMEGYNENTTQFSFYKPIASLAAIAGSTKVSLSAANNNAELIMVSSDIVESFPSQSNIRPRCALYKDSESFAGKALFMLGALIERYEADGITPEDNISMCLIRSAPAMNPSTWIHGATINNAPNRITYGGDRSTRAWMWENFADPNLFVYPFGHNSPIRSGSGFKARSPYQADLFDLIDQDVSDYKDKHGEYPRVLIVCPWAGGNMSETRHSRMMGVVDALNEHGIPTLGISQFNYWGGSSFDGTVPPVNPTDWKDPLNTSFNTNNLGAGLHPDTQNDSRIAHYSIKVILEQAAAEARANATTTRSRGRDRSRATRVLQ